jgi:TPR repeat protein
MATKPHDATIMALVSQIENKRYLCDGSRDIAFSLAEKNRDLDPQIEILYWSFLLPDERVVDEAIKKLKSMGEEPLAAAYLGTKLKEIVLIEKGASGGSVHAMHWFAILLWNGEGVPMNKERAKELLEELVEMKYPPAIFDLGKILYQPPVLQLKDSTGNILPYDATGLNLIRKAAAAGYSIAFEHLRILDRSTR